MNKGEKEKRNGKWNNQLNRAMEKANCLKHVVQIELRGTAASCGRD